MDDVPSDVYEYEYGTEIRGSLHSTSYLVSTQHYQPGGGLGSPDGDPWQRSLMDEGPSMLTRPPSQRLPTPRASTPVADRLNHEAAAIALESPRTAHCLA
jgi:hypothetical protein